MALDQRRKYRVIYERDTVQRAAHLVALDWWDACRKARKEAEKVGAKVISIRRSV